MPRRTMANYLNKEFLLLNNVTPGRHKKGSAEAVLLVSYVFLLVSNC